MDKYFEQSLTMWVWRNGNIVWQHPHKAAINIHGRILENAH